MFSVLDYCMEPSRVIFSRARSWRMVAFGDFVQLPSVRDLKNEDVLFDAGAGYAFDCDKSDRTFGADMQDLKYVCWQDDVEFIGM